MEEQKITLASKPVTITVKPLPAAGKPASFDGAVGKFTISASVPQLQITANETAMMNVILKGEGNLPLINAPQVEWPKGIEGYEPTVKENIDKTVAPISGTKMFQYSFTAKQAGRITIPPVEFSYFDPSANTYKTIRTDSMVANINKAVKKAKHLDAVTDNKVDTTTGVNWRKFLWLSPLLVLVILAIFYYWVKTKPSNKTIASIPAPVQTIKEKEPVATADPFEAATFALAAVNSQLFYKETGKAVWHILSEKFNLTSSQLNKPVVARLLQQANALPETIRLLETVLNDCELALYTPVHTENDMRQTLDKAEKLQQLLAVSS
jgi:hypothetical protein